MSVSSGYSKLAEELGLSLRVAGNQGYGRCPLHKDSNPSFSINLRTGGWTCHFGCGPEEGRDFPTLVMLIRGGTYAEALEWMRSSFPLVPSGEQVAADLVEMLGKYDQETLPPNDLEPLKEWFGRLSNKVMPIPFLARGFTWDTIFRFDIRYDPVGDSVAIPIKDYDGHIVGLTLRFMQPGNRGKYWNNPGFQKSAHLYPLTPRDAGASIILTEGQLDAIYMRQCGYKAACTFGSEVSADQIQLLKRNKTRTIFIAYDNDEAGQKGTVKAINKLVQEGWLFAAIRIVDYPNGRKDANDCSSEELSQALLQSRMVL